VESTNVDGSAAPVESLGEKTGLELSGAWPTRLAVAPATTYSAVLVAAGEIPLMLGIYSTDASA